MPVLNTSEWKADLPAVTKTMPATEKREQPSRGFLATAAGSMRSSKTLFSLVSFGFRSLQRVGISVTPNHFYWPVPDLTRLQHRVWPEPSAPAGVDLRLQWQIDFAEQVLSQYRDEWAFSPETQADELYHYRNGFFETVDAEVAYSLVRHEKPSRIVEVGGGFSSRLMLAALQANSLETRLRSELITIEPFPGERMTQDKSGIVTVIEQPVQDVDIEVFKSLEAGDILFLDSSHVVAVGSDVVREYLEILPNLKSGVIVHVHDIFMPFDYPRSMVLTDLSFWSEQYLVQAFLAFNSEFEILWSSSAMQAFHPEVLEKLFPEWPGSYKAMPEEKRRFVPTLDGDRVWPSSLWIRRR